MSPKFRRTRAGFLGTAVLCLFAGLATADVVAAPSTVDADETTVDADETISASVKVIAQASEPNDKIGTRPLEPRYAPREPEEKSWYNSDYLFGITRSVGNSTIAPAGKVPLFVLTVPLDLLCLPFAAIGGLFG